jgi:hypothetical protein
MKRGMRWLAEKVRELLDYVAYRRVRRSRIRKARKDDSNIYPLW